MAIKPIIEIPDPILNKKAEKVEKFDKDTQNLIEDLIDTLTEAKDPEGMGIAAPQIGVSKRICIVRKFKEFGEETQTFEDFVLINPEIEKFSKDTIEMWEGCLSIPDKYGKVRRPRKVKVKAQNPEGKEIIMNAGGVLARVIQHEVDHLDGILFTSRVKGPLLTENELDALE